MAFFLKQDNSESCSEKVIEKSELKDGYYLALVINLIMSGNCRVLCLWLAQTVNLGAKVLMALHPALLLTTNKAPALLNGMKICNLNSILEGTESEILVLLFTHSL